MEKLSYFLVDCNACVSHIRYLMKRGQGNDVTVDALYVSNHDAVANNSIQQFFCYRCYKIIITIEKLYPHNDEYKYPLDNFLCHNLFAEL